MIVLNALDPMARRASFVDVESALAGQVALADVDLRMRNAGLTNFELALGDESGDPCHLGLSWELGPDSLVYRAAFPHGPTSESWVASYVAVALATSVIDDDQMIMDTWLTAYELTANILDHGTPLQAQARVELTLSLEADRVVGIIQDQCERFDPTNVESSPTQELVQRGSRRGYGMILVKRMSSRLEHEYTETGNRILFVMRREAPVSTSSDPQGTPLGTRDGTT